MTVSSVYDLSIASCECYGYNTPNRNTVYTKLAAAIPCWKHHFPYKNTEVKQLGTWMGDHSSVAVDSVVKITVKSRIYPPESYKKMKKAFDHRKPKKHKTVAIYVLPESVVVVPTKLGCILAQGTLALPNHILTKFALQTRTKTLPL